MQKTVDTRSASAIYCDDIRQEVSGKLTVVGMYPLGTPVRFPPQGGALLPKLCVIGYIRTPQERPLKSLVCELRLDDQVMHRVDLPPEALTAQDTMRPRSNAFTAQIIMEFGNMVVPREGVLRFVAIADDTEVYECHGLEFAKQPDSGENFSQYQVLPINI